MQPDNNSPAPRRARKYTEEHIPLAVVHDESNWLVSYADMMTLLFGFFVLMYSFSRVDQEKFIVVSKDVAKYFGGKQVDNPGAPEGPLKLSKDIDATLSKELGQGGEYNIKLEGNTLVLTIGSDMLFASGSSQLSDHAAEVIAKIYNSVKDQKLELVEVEGHTDADAIATAQFPSNWELSTARASSVVRIFESLKMPSAVLKATGYGASRPAAEKKNEKSEVIPHEKSADRRVVISLKVDPKKSNLKTALQTNGVEITERAPSAIDPEKVEQARTVQEKLEALNLKMKEAAEKLARAKEEQKRANEIEKMTKKAADMEKKIQEIEKRAQETSKEAKQKLEQ